MRRIQLAIIAAALVTTALTADGQNGSLQQSVSSKFALTAIAGDRSAVVTAGTSLVLQKDNLLLYSSACPSSPLNEYTAKKGKLSQPAGKGFLRDLGGSMLMPGGTTTANCPQQRFVRGTNLWMTRIDVQKGGIVLHLYATPDNQIPYYGDLKFPFEKNSLPTADEALATIAEVLTAQQNGDPLNNAQQPAASQQTALQVPTGPSPSESTVAGPQGLVAGLYVMDHAQDNRLQLNADGTLSLRQLGKDYTGTFSTEGDKLRMRIGRVTNVSTLHGNTMVDPSGSTWVKQGAAPEVQNTLRLPATYTNAQTPADQLQLNADNTLTLQEAGQPYHGTFQVNGNTMKIHIDPDTDTTATIDGNKITDASAQKWILREQSAAPAPAETTALRNQDVIQLVKAGLDDATILAKIASSKCQFDTSTDALIQLKTSGVSAAVLKAMVGTGR